MEFSAFLDELKKEQISFIGSLNQDNKSFSITWLDSLKLQIKIENYGKSYFFKCNADENDFADYGEAIASAIASFVGINAIKSYLAQNCNGYGVIMNDFTKEENEYVSLSTILSSFNEASMRTYDKVIAAVKFFCEDNDIICDKTVERDLKRLILLDYLLLQQDRHGENIEFEISTNEKGDSVLKVVPIYDNEFCFLFMFDDRVWDNYKYNEQTFISQIFAFSKEDPVNALANEVIKSEDLTNILERYLKVDIEKLIDFCDEASGKTMPIKYRKVVKEIFENQKKKLCSEIKVLSIKKVIKAGEEDENTIIL